MSEEITKNVTEEEKKTVIYADVETSSDSKARLDAYANAFDKLKAANNK